MENREIKLKVWDAENKALLATDDKNVYWNCMDGVLNAHHSSKNGVWRQLEIIQFTGLSDKNGVEIYQGSMAKFKPPIDKEAAFYNSNCGKIMVKNHIDELLIRFNTSEFLSLDYDIFFIKDGKPVTDLYWFEKCGDNYSDATVEELEKLNVPYTQSDSDINFIRYLIQKGLEVIGNVYQNPELLK